MARDTQVMDQHTFRTFQQACCKGQFAQFLTIANSLPLEQLDEVVRRNLWLFYSELLQRAFEKDNTSATKLKSFSKHANALGQVFLTLPLADQPFGVVRAFEGFYKGCQRAQVDTDTALMEQMIHKALSVPAQQMTALNISNVLPLLVLCHNSNTAELQTVARHYAQGIEEKNLINSKPETIAHVLPYISFDITPPLWANHSSEIRTMVEHISAQQQAQRLKHELPDITCTSPRKM